MSPRTAPTRLLTIFTSLALLSAPALTTSGPSAHAAKIQKASTTKPKAQKNKNKNKKRALSRSEQRKIASKTARSIAKTYSRRVAEVNGDPRARQRQIATFAQKILSKQLDVRKEVLAATGVDIGVKPAKDRKPILLVASTQGTWASEVTTVAAPLLRAGYRVQIATEDGSPPHFLSPSLSPEFQDGAWKGSVVSEAERDLALEFLKPGSEFSQLMDPENIVNLSDLPRPPQVGDYLNDKSSLKRYRKSLKQTTKMANKYDGIIVAGGSGAIPGFTADRGLQNLILTMNQQKKVIAGICNGGLVLAQTQLPDGMKNGKRVAGKSILNGRAVTTHSWLDEYQSGWGWTQPYKTRTGKPINIGQFWKDGQFDLGAYGSREKWVTPGFNGPNVGNPIIDSVGMFTGAAGNKGVFFSPAGSDYSTVVDGNIITGRTTTDGEKVALSVMAVLDGGLKGRMYMDSAERGRRTPENKPAKAGTKAERKAAKAERKAARGRAAMVATETGKPDGTGRPSSSSSLKREVEPVYRVQAAGRPSSSSRLPSDQDVERVVERPVAGRPDSPSVIPE